MADRVEIKIQTVGDASGAEKVGKGLEAVAKSAEKAAVDTAKSQKKSGDEIEKVHKGIKERFEETRRKIEELKKASEEADGAASKGWAERFFPTFSKGAVHIDTARRALGEMGKQIGGMGGMVMQGIANPWVVGSTAVMGAAAKIGQAINDVDTRQKQFLTWAATGWKDMGLAIDRTRQITDNTAESSRKFQAALKDTEAAITTEMDALKMREAAAAKRLADDATLTDAAFRLAAARIDAALADGKLSEAEAAAAKSRLEASAAEDAYAKNSAAADESATMKAEALGKVIEQTKILRELEAAARADYQAFTGQSQVAKAEAVDPSLNRAVADARQSVQVAARESKDPGVMARMEDIDKAVNENLSWWQKAVPSLAVAEGISVIYKTWSEQTARVVEAQAVLEEQTKILAESERRRAEAVRAAETQKRAALESATTAAGGALATETAMRAEVGGLAVPPTVPLINPGDVAALPGSDAKTQLMSVIMDGVDRREAALIQTLVQELSVLNRGAGSQTQEAIKKLQAQVEDLRAKF
jgi:hypothetical protein